ncbi:MAG: RdgB/HAM1 family non-canonical purine NTP pyrophosphatase [Clostridia bacterium]|nr:RdgB/HAM1 family non-canonical purine NTP pyrophosphatase [Clostridia bacterium]
MQYIIATHNAKKLKELSRILVPLGIEAVTDRDLGIETTEVEENGKTFEENAYLKAASACKESGLPAVADDSGLCVDALDGAPGLYSARYAGEGATDEEKIEKILTALADVPKEQRTARFVSAICCVFPDGKTLYARGECEGEIAFEPSGNGGFGYDPVFVTNGKSFADMTAEEKDAVSHRGRSLRAFSQVLKTYLEESAHDQ